MLIVAGPAVALVWSLDLIGTLVFAVSGAVLGMRRGLDLFGVLVLAFVTAVSGGILRDLLIGAVPPASASSPWRAPRRRWMSASTGRWRRRSAC